MGPQLGWVEGGGSLNWVPGDFRNFKLSAELMR